MDDSLAQAAAGVLQLKPERFPAAVWEIPATTDYGRGRLIRKYPAAPGGGLQRRTPAIRRGVPVGCLHGSDDAAKHGADLA